MQKPCLLKDLVRFSAGTDSESEKESKESLLLVRLDDDDDDDYVDRRYRELG